MEKTRQAIEPCEHLYSIAWQAFETYWYVIALCGGIAVAYLLARVFAPRRKLLFKMLEFATYVSIPILFLMQADFTGSGGLQEYSLNYIGHCHITIVGILLTTAIILSITMLLTPLLIVLCGSGLEGKQSD